MTKQIPQPEIGQKVWVGGRLSDMSPHLDHPGGWGIISDVTPGTSAGETVPFVKLRQLPQLSFNWLTLYQEQDELKARYGDQETHEDPDTDSQGDGFPRMPAFDW